MWVGVVTPHPHSHPDLQPHPHPAPLLKPKLHESPIKGDPLKKSGWNAQQQKQDPGKSKSPPTFTLAQIGFARLAALRTNPNL